MEMDNPNRSLSRRQEKNLLKAAAAAARTEFDSPERMGCPESETLNLLARRHSSLVEIADLVDHIATCSPCFVEYSRHRAAHKLRVGVYYALASVAAAVALALVVALSMQIPGVHLWPSPKEIARSEVQRNRVTDLVLDLRMKSASRSDTPNRQGDDAPARLPRTRLSLSIQLPIGSEDGIYDVALISSVGQSVLETRGKAARQNFVEVLRVELNLTDLAAGLYQLRFRRAQTQWSSYSILLE